MLDNIEYNVRYPGKIYTHAVRERGFWRMHSILLGLAG